MKTVKVVTYLLDKDGQRIWEDDYTPVSSYSLLGSSDLLKPNYVRNFGYILKDVPRIEKGMRFEVAVDGVEFAE